VYKKQCLDAFTSQHLHKPINKDMKYDMNLLKHSIFNKHKDVEVRGSVNAPEY